MDVRRLFFTADTIEFTDCLVHEQHRLEILFFKLYSEESAMAPEALS